MIPVKLSLSNFTSYGTVAPELDFSKIHLAAISGANGVGKSSLLDAITWCIWGTSRAGDSADQLIRLGQEVMWVEFTFELDSNLYTIKRSRKLNSSTSLEFTFGTNNLTEGTIKATQQKIIDTLHLTFDTFVNSAYIRQGHADEFTTKGPTERKKILTDILGLAQYDLLEERAKEKTKDVQSKLSLLEYQLLEIEAEITASESQEAKQQQISLEVQKLEQTIKQLESELKLLRSKRETLEVTKQQSDKLLENYQQLKQELDSIAVSGKERKARIEVLKEGIKSLDSLDEKLSQLAAIQSEVEDLTNKKHQRLEIEKQILEITGQLELKKQQINQFESKITEIEHDLNELEKTQSKCPTCKQVVDKIHKQEAKTELGNSKDNLIKQLKQISIEFEQASLKKLKSDLDKIPVDESHFLQLQTALRELQQLQSQKEALIQKQATLASEEKVVLELRDLYSNKKTQVDKLELEIKKLPDLSVEVLQVNNQIEEFETKLQSLRQSEKTIQSQLGEIKQLISRFAQLQKSKSVKTEEKDKLKKDKEIYEELSLAFGKKGIQAMIIESAIPEIEEETNKLLQKLTDGRMSVQLVTQRETKTKDNLVETLDIIISDEMGQRAYELYSGGEAFRVNLSLRLALSKLLTHRAGSNLQFLIIDEGFGTQDSSGLGRIIEALNTIKEDFAKILVITHLDELKEEFDVRIEVSKGPTGSTFQVVGV